MPDPTGRVSHLPHFHRGVAWKEPCRVATTANVTIATALNAGDSIDGVTLAAGDRVLVKSQSTGSQNGIYVVSASPARAYDMDQDGTTTVPAEEVAGAFVYVIAGTVNAGKVFHTTNVAGATLGSTTITWTEFTSGGGGVDVTDGTTTVSPTTEIEFDPTDFQVTDQGGGSALVELIGSVGGGAPTDEKYIVGGAAAGLSAERVREDLYHNYNPDAYPSASGLTFSDEFDDGVVAGWTWNSAPTGSPSETRYPGFYYVNGHTSNVERYFYRAFVPGSTAFTVVAKVTPVLSYGNFSYALGPCLLTSSNTVIAYSVVAADGTASAIVNHRVSGAGTTLSLGGSLPRPIYLAISRDSSTGYSAYFSFDGMGWVSLGNTTSASTVGRVGLMYQAPSGAGARFLCDFIRIFDTGAGTGDPDAFPVIGSGGPYRSSGSNGLLLALG